MNTYNLYKFANQPIIKAVRIGLFTLFAVLFVLNISNMAFLQKMLLFYFVFAVSELFIHEKINTGVSKKLGQNASPEEATMYSSRFVIGRNNNISDSIQTFSFSKETTIRLFMARLGVSQFEKGDVNKDELFKKAAAIATENKKEHINELDFVTAYLLLTETQTKFLLHRELHEKDIMAVYIWIHGQEKSHKKHPISVPATGAFDGLVTGWNYELRKYAVNITDDVVSERREPRMIALDTQYQQFLNDLSRNRENNILLVGEAGVGKRNIVRKFAFDSHFHHLENNLNNKTVFELLTDRLISGEQSQFAERLEYLLAELAHTGNVIVYIENIENLMGGGGFNLDVSGTLAPYLENGSFTIIGTINPAFYQKYIEPHTSINQHFSKISIPEPNPQEAIEITLAHVEELESKYGVWVVYSAIPESVKLSSSYYPDRYLPGRAINLLEEVLSTAKNQKEKIIDKHDVRSVVAAKTNIVTEEPGNAEKELLLHLEDRMHEKLIDQEEAVSAIAKAMRRLRSGFENRNRPIASFLFLGPTGVGKTETAKRLAELYFGSETAMIRLDMSEYQTQDAIRKLLGEMPGEEIVSNSLADQIREHPFSLVLLDEFEKAHQELLNLFLQILDEGKITDNRGKTASFNNAMIIATSNAGSEFIRESQDSPELEKQLLDALLSSNRFKPELINRFDDVVVFHPLSQEHARQVAQLILKNSLQKLDEEQIIVEFDDSLLDSIITNGYSHEFGARNLRRYIQDNVEEFVSRQILENKLVRGDKKRLSVDASGQFVIT